MSSSRSKAAKQCEIAIVCILYFTAVSNELNEDKTSEPWQFRDFVIDGEGVYEINQKKRFFFKIKRNIHIKKNVQSNAVVLPTDSDYVCGY